MGLEKRLHIKSDISVFVGNPKNYLKSFKKILIENFTVTDICENTNNTLLSGKIRGRKDKESISSKDLSIGFRLEKSSFIGSARTLHIRYDYNVKDNEVPDLKNTYECIDKIVELAEKARNYE